MRVRFDGLRFVVTATTVVHAISAVTSVMGLAMGLSLTVALTSTRVMAQAPVSDPRKLAARITQLERSMSGSSLLQMHQTLQDLAREVRELRGEMEQQTHSMKQLERRQREMFLDLDRRMQAVETATPAPGGAAPAVTPQAAQLPAQTPAAAVVPPQAPPAGVATVDRAAEQRAYRAAFDLLKGGKFTEATAALTQFLRKYPSGDFADNAPYWLGEAYYVDQEFGPALQAFEQLLVDYPDSPKRPHSMLKIGFIYDEMGQKDKARKMLTELTIRYPKSTAASLATKRLKRLQ